MEKETFDFRITTEESETVERAYFEARSFEALMNILCRNLVAENSDKAKEVLMFYSEPCRRAQEKLALAQRMVVSKYIPSISKFSKWEANFNFEDERMTIHAYQ
ncbi:MAG: hypothetical protein ACI4JC_01010 [Faecalibacterium sp.]